MGFDTGRISYVRFNVVGEGPRLPDEETLNKFETMALRQDELTTSEVDYGWCGPRHIEDVDFNVGNVVYNDCVHVGLIVVTNRVPPEVKRAYVEAATATAAATNPSGFASKRQKAEAREASKRQIEADLASGRYRRSKLVNVLWDVPNHTLYAAVGASQAEQLAELFERTHNLTLDRLTSGRYASEAIVSQGRIRDYEDLTPTRFAAIAGDPPAEYPWTAKGDQAKDFLGNEFVVWLWHVSSGNGCVVKLGDRDVTLMFSDGMDLDCVYGQSGRVVARFEVPTEMPEVLDALRAGKVPRHAGMVLADRGQLYAFTLNAEGMTIARLKLPDVEKADSARVLFEERITLLRDFGKTLDDLYRSFLAFRSGEDWDALRGSIQRRIAGKAASR